MTSRTLKTLQITAVLLLTATLARAACETCRYTDRGDRLEGVDDWQVSGGSFDLLAVQYRQGAAASSSGEKLHLYFWLPAPLTPTIEVREPSRNYMMHPVKKPHTAGLQTFAWPLGEVIRPLGLDAGRLYAKVSNREETLYFPAFLSNGKPPAAGGTYVFVFASGSGIDVNCSILRDDGGTLVTVRKWVYTDEHGGRLPIEWDGRDDKGQPVPPGSYTLRLKGDMLAETTRPLTRNLSFVHYGRFQ